MSVHTPRYETVAVTALEALMCSAPDPVSSICGLPAVIDEQKIVFRLIWF